MNGPRQDAQRIADYLDKIEPGRDERTPNQGKSQEAEARNAGFDTYEEYEDYCEDLAEDD